MTLYHRRFHLIGQKPSHLIGQGQELCDPELLRGCEAIRVINWDEFLFFFFFFFRHGSRKL